MMEIRLIDREHSGDIRLPNQPFPLWGRMKPSYLHGKWDYTTEQRPPEEVTELCFPDENYDFDAMADCCFLGAYEGSRCVGLAVYREAMFRYYYLYDLKVDRDCRGRGVGRMLIEAGMRLAREKGYRGVYTIGQDTNLTACLFYLKCGFQIGGLDTRVYTGTSQEGTADILFYRDVK